MEDKLPDESQIFKRNKFTDLEKLLVCNSYVKQLKKDITNLNKIVNTFKEEKNKEIDVLETNFNNQFKDYAKNKNKEIEELRKKLSVKNKPTPEELIISENKHKDKKLKKLNKELKLEKEKVKILLTENRKLILTQK